jgi:hypothetical protein
LGLREKIFPFSQYNSQKDPGENTAMSLLLATNPKATGAKK